MELSVLRPRAFSQNVRELHGALTEVLNNAERQVFLQSLNQYKRDRNVKSFVTSLKSVLNSPKKREIYPSLREIIPVDDRQSFDRTWLYGLTDATPRRSKSPNHLANRQTPSRLPASVSLPERLNYASADSGIDLPPDGRFRANTPPREKYPIKRIVLKRGSAGFGFSIRGGAEHGVGLYVSSVDKDSVADKQGLLPGDHVLIVNETQLDGLTHAEAVRVIKHNKKITLTVRSVGHIPSTFIAEETYTWIDTRGRRASPPPEVDSSGRHLTADGIHKSDLRLLGDDDERKVNVFVEDGLKLGLLIRGGTEYGLGIFIAGVDPNGAADRAGLKSGDQIMDVNGRSFLSINHKEAVKILKSTKNMILTLKDVGRLPLARTTHDKTKWIKGTTHKIQSQLDACPITDVDQYTTSQHPLTVSGDLASKDRRHTTAGNLRHGINGTGRPEQSMFHHGVAGTQLLHGSGVPSQKHLIAEQARHLLSENELGTLIYYMNEYAKGYISIKGFVLALFDLLNTPAKMSLLSEIRGSVSPRDLDKFDDLLLKKEIEIMKSEQFMYNRLADDSHSLHSYSSSVSSFSGRGSVSSKSSTKSKGSHNGFDGPDVRSITPPRLKSVALHGPDSRPITPPHVPEVLPPNLMAREYDTYEATLTFTEQQIPLEMEGQFGLPDVLKIDSTNLDPPENGTVPSPTQDDFAAFPIFTSTPRDNEDITMDTNAPVKLINGSGARTKGEVTVNELTDDNGNIASKDQTRDIKHSQNDERVVMANGDILPQEASVTLECEPVASKTLCNGDLTTSKDYSFDDSTDKTLTNDVSVVNVSENDRVQFGINNNMYSVKPTDESGNAKPTSDIKEKNFAESLSPRIETKLERKTEVLTESSSDWKPVRLVHSNEASDVRLSDNSLDESKPVKLVTVEVTSRPMVPPPVHQKPAKSRPRLTGVSAQPEVYEPPRAQEPAKPPSPGVHNLVQRYNQMSDESAESTPSSSRRGSVSSQTRRSWDGVRISVEDSDEKLKVSSLARQKRKEKSISDSSLMVKNLPKEQQKNIQTKRLASQELFDLHQNSKNMVNSSPDLTAHVNNLKVVVLDKDGQQTAGTVPTLISHDAPQSSELEVEVEKTSKSLGLIIEGGSDTAHKEITVKHVKEGDYSAYRCSKLHAGQVILEVDGTSFREISNGRAVLKLRQAYTSLESNVMKLLIKENGLT